MTPDEIARRALQAVGTPFRLYGRKVGVALDCVGLVLHATQILDRITSYTLKGDHLDLIRIITNQKGFKVQPSPNRGGDIAVVQCGPRQQHLLIHVSGGWVHAHAGLRRVVFTPGPLPWPLIAAWRLQET
jgi:murein DD-endopeptidase / murein LD-carboxypeptidase